MYELGPNLSAGINRMAVELMVHLFVDTALQIPDPADDSKTAFTTPKDVIDYLAEHPDLTSGLEEKRPRWELALGTSLLCALIIRERESAKGSMKPRGHRKRTVRDTKGG